MTEVIKISTGYKPHKFQFHMHSNLRRFSVVVAHRRFGKTVAAVNSLIDAALRFPRTDGRFAYVAPYLKQAKQVAWDYLKHYTRSLPDVKYNEAELSCELGNGSRIRLYGADNPDSIRGIYLDGVVLDEVADMRPETWGEVIRPALADRKGWSLFIGTPKGINMFSELYFAARDGFDDGNGNLILDPAWRALMYRVDETGLIDDDELDASRRTMTDNQYRQEWLCDFTASTDNTLITIDMVSEAAKRHYAKDDYMMSPMILGVDVARYGGDRCVIFPRQGLVAHTPRVFINIDNMEFAAKVAHAANELKADQIFIDAGRGEGVIDRLRQLGFSCVEVPFGGRPLDDRYVNKRSEMWDEMANWFRAGGQIPNNTDLKTDLCVPTYDHKNASGKFQLESKEKIRERGLKSPDIADALALTFAYPVAAKLSRRDPVMRQQSVSVDYDPFARDRLNVDYNPLA